VFVVTPDLSTHSPNVSRKTPGGLLAKGIVTSHVSSARILSSPSRGPLRDLRFLRATLRIDSSNAVVRRIGVTEWPMNV
jgi:hypothetical protein